MRATYPLALVCLTLLVTRAPAQLQVTPQTLDVGTVKSGQLLTGRFTLTNLGQQPIEFVEAKSSCGCLKPKLPASPLPPGGKCTWTVEVNTLAQPAGPVAWNAQVSYRTHGQLSEASLTIGAQLIQEITVEPPALQLFTSKELSASVRILDSRGQLLKLKTIRTSSPHLKFDSASYDAYELDFAVTVTDAFPEGRHEEVVSIYLDDPAYPELKVPVTIVKNARQRVVATPTEVVLRCKPAQPVPARIVLLRDSEGEPVVIERIQPQHHHVKCSWASGPDAMVTLRVSADPQLLVKEGEVNVEVRTALNVFINQPVKQVLTIPVRLLLE